MSDGLRKVLNDFRCSYDSVWESSSQDIRNNLLAICGIQQSDKALFWTLESSLEKLQQRKWFFQRASLKSCLEQYLQKNGTEEEKYWHHLFECYRYQKLHWWPRLLRWLFGWERPLKLLNSAIQQLEEYLRDRISIYKLRKSVCTPEVKKIIGSGFTLPDPWDHLSTCTLNTAQGWQEIGAHYQECEPEEQEVYVNVLVNQLKTKKAAILNMEMLPEVEKTVRRIDPQKLKTLLLETLSEVLAHEIEQEILSEGCTRRLLSGKNLSAELSLPNTLNLDREDVYKHLFSILQSRLAKIETMNFDDLQLYFAEIINSEAQAQLVKEIFKNDVWRILEKIIYDAVADNNFQLLQRLEIRAVIKFEQADFEIWPMREVIPKCLSNWMCDIRSQQLFEQFVKEFMRQPITCCDLKKLIKENSQCKAVYDKAEIISENILCDELTSESLKQIKVFLNPDDLVDLCEKIKAQSITGEFQEELHRIVLSYLEKGEEDLGLIRDMKKGIQFEQELKEVFAIKFSQQEDLPHCQQRVLSLQKEFLVYENSLCAELKKLACESKVKLEEYIKFQLLCLFEYQEDSVAQSVLPVIKQLCSEPQGGLSSVIEFTDFNVFIKTKRLLTLMHQLQKANKNEELLKQFIMFLATRENVDFFKKARSVFSKNFSTLFCVQALIEQFAYHERAVGFLEKLDFFLKQSSADYPEYDINEECLTALDMLLIRERSSQDEFDIFQDKWFQQFKSQESYSKETWDIYNQFNDAGFSFDEMTLTLRLFGSDLKSILKELKSKDELSLVLNALSEILYFFNKSNDKHFESINLSLMPSHIKELCFGLFNSKLEVFLKGWIILKQTGSIESRVTERLDSFVDWIFSFDCKQEFKESLKSALGNMFNRYLSLVDERDVLEYMPNLIAMFKAQVRLKHAGKEKGSDELLAEKQLEQVSLFISGRVELKQALVFIYSITSKEGADATALKAELFELLYIDSKEASYLSQQKILRKYFQPSCSPGFFQEDSIYEQLKECYEEREAYGKNLLVS